MRRTELTVPRRVAEQAEHEAVTAALENSNRWGRSEDVLLSDRDMSEEVLADLVRASDGVDKPFHRVVEAIALGRKGKFKAIPRMDAAPEILRAYLQHEMLDGWVYQRTVDGGLRAYLVTGIAIDRSSNRDGPDRVVIRASYNSIVKDSDGRIGRGSALTTTSWSMEPGQVTRKQPSAILEDLGLMHETPALRREYHEHVERYRQILTEGFARQYRYSGSPMGFADRSYDLPSARAGVKVVHDVAPGEIALFMNDSSSSLVDDEQVLPVPMHFDLRVFDLATHRFLMIDTRGLEEYTYDQSLRDKLVLPADQRDLLDILTKDISTFTSDMIEGKSAGNVVLCKGVPGVGKTLSAEVYAELTERPLYSIHSGSLGVTADAVRKNLEKIFQRAQRWDAVLLLDEADVFVIERGDNLEQNAIVAEFLRTMEYFTGLMFMTTNRADSIDEAIVSRCAAMIDYRVPGREDARQIWHVLAGLSETTLEESLVEALLDGFPKIAPRDIKMLLRLTLRVSLSKGEPLSVELFRRCAMFRGLHFEGGK